jgi:hypothetical protein
MFNYEKLAVAKAEAQAAKAALALAKELYERLLAGETAEIARLREEVGNQHGKISLMETILMPLSSNAGAAYQELLNPPKKQIRKAIVEPPMSDWQRYKVAKEKELEAEYLSEEPHAISQQETT